MRKQFKLLLLVATVLALFVMAMIVGSADGNVCKIGTTEYATFDAAYAAATDGQTIELIADTTVATADTKLSKSITIDGGTNRYKLIIAATSKKSMFTTSVNDKTLTFKNLKIDVQENTAKYGIIRGGKNYSGTVVAFDNCTVDSTAAGVVCSGRLTVNINDCTINSPGYFVCNNNGNNFETNITVTGNTTVNITGGTTGFTYANGCNLTIGAQGQNNDNIKINVPTTLLVVADPATPTAVENDAQTGSLTVWGGTITATAANSTNNGMIVANGNTVNIYGGTFVSELAGTYLFDSNLDGGSEAAINIAGGTFVLSGGANFANVEKVPAAKFTTSATTLGDITFKLGAGSADNEAVQAVLNNATLWSKAKFYITSWPGAASVANPTITAAGTYNRAQFDALFVGAAGTDPIVTYTGLGSFFVQNTNLFLDAGFETITTIIYSTVTINVNGTVTLKDINFAVTTNTWIKLEAGKLVLDNCNITVAEDAGVTYFVFSEADGVILEVTGGSYDMTNTSVDKPVPFKIGVRAKGTFTSTANTEVSFTNTSIYSKGSYVIGIEYIKSLTITNCFLSYTNAIAKGEIGSVTDAALLEGSNNGILTDAITTTISDTVIYAGNGTVAIQGRNDGADRQAPTVNLENVTIYADRGISYSVGAVNLTDCNFKAHPGDDRHISIQLAGTVTVTVVGGSFAQNETLTTKENNMFEFKAAGATLNISDATITAYVGNVFNFAEDAAGTLTVEDCYITVCGTEQSIVNDAAGTSTITLTKSSFAVENVQETTVETVTTKIALFVGTIEFNDVAVLAKEGTLVQGTSVLDAYAYGISYSGNVEYKLWVADAGDFENSAAADEKLYVATGDIEQSGLKFSTEISKAVIDGLIAEKTSKGIKDIRFYTLVAPMDYLVEARGVFTKEALDAARGNDKTNYVAIEAVNSLEGFNAGTNATTADTVKFSGSLVSLNSYTRVYAAVSMIVFEYNDNTTDTFYGDFCSADNARTAQQVAGIVKDLPDYQTATAIVNKYLSGVV